jgi:hypothetical protein
MKLFRTSVVIEGQMEIRADTREEAEERAQEIASGMYDGKYLKCIGVDDVKLEVLYERTV